jgi:hypothetical protein
MSRDARGSEAAVAPPVVRSRSTVREYAETLGVAPFDGKPVDDAHAVYGKHQHAEYGPTRCRPVTSS